MRGNRMSGGSYEYLYYKMEDAAHTLMRKDQVAYRIAFGNLMLRCAQAMHDVEWVDSCDKSPGDDEEAIMKCINFSDVLRVTVSEAENMKKELEKLITAAKKVK